MPVELLSITHRTAPVAIRERLALDAAARAALMARLAGLTGEAVALCTCNRTELYWTARPAATPGDVLALLAVEAGFDPGSLEPCVVHLRGAAAARHLCRVAAGLESQVLGEPQILGQVREAAEEARAAGAIGPVLDRLFTLAVVAGKRARTETAIGRGAGSIGQAAVQLARSILGELAGKRALVVGAGEMGRLVAASLVSYRPGWLGIANRTGERAREVARKVGAQPVPWECLDEALAAVELAVVATAAQEPVLTRRRLERVVAARGGRLLLLIDIAVPRNVEPAVAGLPGIELRDIDALETLCAEGRRARERAIPQVEAIVKEQVEEFLEWERARAVAPVIQQLRERIEAIREEETTRALRRLGHLSERDRQVVLALSHGIANKLLHLPISRLRERGDQEPYIRVAADLFGLDLE
jgi:glutamyl-tRNA reductase